ncbi:MAG: DEAD/DEAH box helicase [Bacteroides sp.]|jgi:superfamily II DNA or RNA helicase|nr:DEAD/DEAH box helicase [Bacteroides sp.]
MQPPQYNGFENEFQLVFAITENPPMGFMIEPFAVKVIGQRQFSYEFHRINPVTAGDFFPGMTQPYRQLLKLYGNYAEEALLKRFNKENIKPSQFFESLTPEFVAEHLRPLIDKTMAEMASVLLKNGLPLHYKGLKDDRILEESIPVALGLVEPVFYFQRLESGLRYRLLLFHQNEELSLKGEDALMLGLKPCLLIIEGQLFRFDKEWDGKKLNPFFTRDEIMVPKSSERAYFQKFVMDAIRHYRVEAEGFEIVTLQASPKPVLKLEQNWQNHWSLQLAFRYGDEVFGPGDEGISKVSLKEERGTFVFSKVARDLTVENQWVDKMESLGLVNRKGDGFYLWYPAKKTETSGEEAVLAGLYDYLDWLAAYSEALDMDNIEVQKDEGTGSFFLGRPQVSLEVTDRNDWFDLYGTVSFGPHRIPFLRLKNHILHGIREFSLPDGTIGLIPSEWFGQYQDVMKFALGKGSTLQLKRHHFTLLGQLKETSTPVKGLDEAMKNFTPPPLPTGIEVQLRPYQLQGFQWMSFLYQHRLGGCLADDMGLGKTLQTLAILLHAHREASGEDKAVTPPEAPPPNPPQRQLGLFDDGSGEAPPSHRGTSLLVMPLSLIHNWLREIYRFTPQLKVLQHTGPARKTCTRAFLPYDLVLTTYGTVRNDIQLFEGFQFNYVVLDESQIIKNAESKIFHAIKKLKARHRLVLTGTPVENSLTDLWAQFSFLNPGLLGNLNYYREEFVLPVEKNNDLRKQQKLHTLIEPFILRRTKSEVAKELPELTETVRYCEMSEEHRKYYETKKSQIRNLILEQVEHQGMDRSRFFILSSLMKLRLMANHPFMVDPEYAFDSGKFIEVRENIGKVLAEGHKVLIFSQFVKHLNIYRHYLDGQGLPYNLLTGQMPEKERGRLISEFQHDPDKRLFLISLKAGGLGLNLTGADYVFMLDPWWNPAVEKQAINRAHRIGQKKNVFVYKFITRDTVEEKILSLQQRKSTLAGMLIDQNNPLKNMGLNEIRDLIN